MRPLLTLTLIFVYALFRNTLAAPIPFLNFLSKDTSDQIARTHELREHESQQKYFHEPGDHGPRDDELLGHYDTRFFRGLLSYDEKRDTQVHMIRAYLDTFRAHGMKTWIAHGTLLGWWWNAKVSVVGSSPSISVFTLSRHSSF